MRLRLGDAPYLPVAMVHEDSSSITIGVTFARDIRSINGDFDKCEAATLVGMVREMLEISQRLQEAMAEHRFAQVDLETYVPNSDDLIQSSLNFDEQRQVVYTSRP